MREQYIVAVENIKGVIERVELRGNLQIREYGVVKTRQEIISLLKSGANIFTAIKTSSDPLFHKKGSRVIIYNRDNEEFIRSESNGSDDDNLDNLPSSSRF